VDGVSASGTAARGPSLSGASWWVGNVRVTRIEESLFHLPLAYFIPGADAPVRERFAGQLSAHHLDGDGSMTLVIGAFVLESQGARILVDTCVGAENERAPVDSTFLESLAAAGFPADTIDVVVCSHVHFDHVGWNTTEDGHGRRPTFPKARYVFCDLEWQATRDADPDEVLYSSLGRDVAWVIDRGLADLVGPTHRLTDEVSLLPTFGHSPGHVSVLVESAGEHGIVTGDAAHHPVQLLDATLASTADGDPGQAAASRLSLIDRVIAQNAKVFGTHFAAPCVVELHTDETGLTLRPVLPDEAPTAASATVSLNVRTVDPGGSDHG
jgi:glyoxylase-like metal-dependent hydrolase (beta-lactamase superfamily II)